MKKIFLTKKENKKRKIDIFSVYTFKGGKSVKFILCLNTKFMKPRCYSETGYESVILRGIARQAIFYEKTDKSFFKSVMFGVADAMQIEIIGYALMANQVRIELKTQKKGDLSDFIKRICIKYVRHYFNVKYERNGSLFQNRFINENLKENDILNANREILQAYTDSKESLNDENCSYLHTVAEFTKTQKPGDKSFCFSKLIGLNNYVKYIATKDVLNIPRLAYTPNREEIALYIKKVCESQNVESFYKLTNKIRCVILRNLKRNHVSFHVLAKLLSGKYRTLLRFA